MISCDSVYQKVLAIANKEQRGYITPQEFNLLADQAQMDIFEQYFYDLNLYKRGAISDIDLANIGDNIEEKISIFEVYKAEAGVSGIDVSLPVNMYRLNSICIRYSSTIGGFGLGPVTNYGLGDQSTFDAEELQLKEFDKYANAKLMAWSKRHPCFFRISPTLARVYPILSPLDGDIPYVSYVKRPKRPNWTYTTLQHQSGPIYFPTTDTQDFELHPSEESKLVVKILQSAGVVIKDYNLVQVASAKETAQVQQEKQ